MTPHGETRAQYAEFARHTAGQSDCFTDWADAVVADPDVLAWIDSLPGIKRQPNLVFAAARWHGVPAPGPYAGLREALLGDDGAIRATILERATQTNEVGRLATLVPAFCAVAAGRPVAVLEAGASAGLTLYPDRWGYAWSTPDAVVEVGPEPRLNCVVTGPAPLPTSLPEITWRGGLDLKPIDVADEDSLRWLETLVWPEDEPRRARLRHAAEIALADPPALVRGDMLHDLPDLIAEAGEHGPVIVFHSAVAAYLSDEDRGRFDTLMQELVAQGACHWISNEAPGVVPSLSATIPANREKTAFVLGIDGSAVAFTHGHGRSLDWIG
ncbi:DUF2332 domain-containing protein [Nocardioides sp.]|uniref:DUF2332 domain-containing protein n=1 Tax=Nocardioides sp. TaxID=35761 RepID=UPI00356526F9